MVRTEDAGDLRAPYCDVAEHKARTGERQKGDVENLGCWLHRKMTKSSEMVLEPLNHGTVSPDMSGSVGL